MSVEIRLDAMLPQEMAQKAEMAGIRKAALPFLPLVALAVLAGAFVALGSMFATTAVAASSALPYGVARLLFGLVFCLGLILVVIGGAELFTGNNLIVMAWASRKVSTWALLRNWLVVYVGNFVGSLATAVLIFLGKQYNAGGGSVGEVALKIAVGKVNLGFVQALVLGMLCNALVCLAIWLTYSARTVADKILAIIFPVTAFAAAGFEHSIANMYFISYALLIKTFDPAFTLAKQIDLSSLTWSAFFLKNLLPVTLGNILGGSVLVAAMYWFIYLRKNAEVPSPDADPKNI
jgi:formate/nitrite transporter